MDSRMIEDDLLHLHDDNDLFVQLEDMFPNSNTGQHFSLWGDGSQIRTYQLPIAMHDQDNGNDNTGQQNHSNDHGNDFNDSGEGDESHNNVYNNVKDDGDDNDDDDRRNNKKKKKNTKSQ